MVAAGFGLAPDLGLRQAAQGSSNGGLPARGIVLGPTTPGFVVRVSTAYQASEKGVMLLMRGVGLNFAGQRPRGGSAPRSRVTWSGSALQQFLGSGVPMLAGAGARTSIRLADLLCSTATLVKTVKPAASCLWSPDDTKAALWMN